MRQPDSNTDGRNLRPALAAKEQAEVRRGRNGGTRLEDGDWDLSVFSTDLPSRADHSPVRAEADHEHDVALRGGRTVPEDAGALGVCDEC